jgi:hypothetical protein
VRAARAHFAFGFENECELRELILFCCGAAKFIFPRKRKKFFLFSAAETHRVSGGG